MTTAAKRARKKANKLKGWPDPEAAPEDFAEVGPPEVSEEPVATESEHAAALTALAAVKRMRKKTSE